LIEVRFASCRDLARAKTAVSRAGKNAFTLEVLTEFQSIAREHTLIFALSEAASDQRVSRLLQDLPSFAPEKAACATGSPGPRAP
jgi:hypothetical protein